MGIINRTMDASEQKELVTKTITSTTTGKDYVLYRAPRSVILSDAKAVVVGMSGAPTSTLKLQRFVVGAGLTTISVSGALTHTAIGTSGVQTFSLPAAGSSLLAMQAGDFLVCTSGASNAAVEQLMVDLVVYAVQDIKTWG